MLLSIEAKNVAEHTWIVYVVVETPCYDMVF
jgi:hypothetical protein